MLRQDDDISSDEDSQEDASLIPIYEPLLEHIHAEPPQITREMVIRFIKTAALCSGSVIMDAGNKVLALPSFFEYYEMDNPKLVFASSIMAIVFAVQMNALTRGYAVWQWFSPDLRESEKFSNVVRELYEGFRARGVCGKCVCIMMSTAMVAATFLIATRTFSASDALLRFCGVKNDYVLYTIDGYLSLTGIIAFFAFTPKIFMRNLFYICDNLGMPRSLKTAWTEFFNGTLRAIAQTMVSNYVIVSMFEQFKLIKFLDMPITKPLILATSAVAMFSFSASRSLEIYKLKVAEKEKPTQVIRDTTASPSWKKTFLSFINEIGGVLYAVFFFMTVSASLVDAEDEFGIPTQPRYMDIINLVLLSIGAVLVEYNFIVSKARQNLNSISSFFFGPAQAAPSIGQPTTAIESTVAHSINARHPISSQAQNFFSHSYSQESDSSSDSGDEMTTGRNLVLPQTQAMVPRKGG